MMKRYKLQKNRITYLLSLLILYIVLNFVYLGIGCKSNKPPEIPVIPAGPDSGYIDNYTFVTFSDDPDGDSIAIKFDWGDGDESAWSNFVESGDTVSIVHFYGEIGNYAIKAKAKDIHDKESEWSGVHILKIGSDLLWTKDIGGPGDDYGYSIQPTPDNHYIIAGATNSYGAGGFDIYLIKIDSMGNVIWEKTFGGSGDDYGYAVKNTGDGGYIIVGKSISFGAVNNDVYLVKTDALGNMVWQKTYGGINTDYGYDVDVTTNGYIITGMTSSSGAGSGDVWLIRTDLNGDTIWTKTFGGAELDCGNSIKVTDDNGYIIAGYTYSFGRGSDVYLVKTDSNGDTLWTKTYGTGAYDIGNMVRQTTDNGYIVVGGNGNVYIIKIDNLGNLVWEKTYGSTHTDYGYGVEQLSGSGYLIIGYIMTDNIDVYYLKIDAGGNKIKEQFYGDWQYNYGYSLALTPDEGCIIAGYTKTNIFKSNVYIIRVAR